MNREKRRFKTMKKFIRFVFALCVVSVMACVTAAQEKSSGIPKVLTIQREFVKPGRGGMIHDKTESAFVDAMRQAKWPTYYEALESLSGPTRVLFLTRYESFEAWQKDEDAVGKNTGLAASLDRASMADGQLLDSADQGVFYFHEEMSLRPRTDVSTFRYFEITVFHVKPGKDKEWEEVVKMAKAGYEKGVPDAHWGMFEEIYGGDAGIYILMTGHKSMSEIDKGFAEGKQFEAVMGEEGMKKLNEMFASCVSATQSQLFEVNPHMSYVSEDWIKADPDLWKPQE